jgi:hypothetical protein
LLGPAPHYDPTEAKAEKPFSYGVPIKELLAKLHVNKPVDDDEQRSTPLNYGHTRLTKQPSSSSHVVAADDTPNAGKPFSYGLVQLPHRSSHVADAIEDSPNAGLLSRLISNTRSHRSHEKPSNIKIIAYETMTYEFIT